VTGALVGLLAALATATATALPEDRLKAIAITADRAERHERGGYTIYIGSVVLEQGSLHIEADRLTIFHDREAADRIVAVGKPARMRQQPAIDKGLVHASAMRIVYEKSRELVLLKDTASIEQDGAVVTGESIEYFMAEQRVRADSAATDDSARVQVFIPAEVVEEQTGGGDDGDAASETDKRRKGGDAADEDRSLPQDAAPDTGDAVGMTADDTETDGDTSLADGDAGRP
jgi:lipopolysaccharide export system protein LptA